MGSHLPEKLRITCAVLGTLSLLTTGLRCYVRLRIVKSWGLDDYFIVVAVVCLLVQLNGTSSRKLMNS
jgi:hypothetical protein